MRSAIDTSQHGEVAYIRSLIDADVPQCIVDVGAHNGKQSSHSLPFIEEGWRAVCIEPHPTEFANLQRLHADNPRVQCREAAITNRHGTEKLYVGQYNNTAVSTICTDTNDWFTGICRDTSIDVQGRTLNSVLHECKTPDIGILSIDAEGMDYEVLTEFDIAAYTPRVIITEEYVCNPAKHFAKHAMLRLHDYIHQATLGCNSIWIPRKYEEQYRHLRTVTIVVPVYNQWPLVQQCIESLKQYVPMHHKIFLIDDASTQEGMEQNIRSAIRDMPNATYVRNTHNIGFVGTCNRVRELDRTHNDVLLLNSDAMLTEGCIEEMLTCLHANERYGVCTPRSNAATIYSIGQTVSEPRDAFACWQNIKHLLPRTTVMPTGHGFCMLIRREMILRFGLFDTIYGKGYHEENDFCMRIAQYGYLTIAANHAFVFHKDSASFGAKRAALDQKNGVILHKRYPEYKELLKEAQWNIDAIDHFAWHIAPATSLRIAIDLTHLGAVWNGTSTYVMNILPHIVETLSMNADVIIITTKAADTFFKLHHSYNVTYYHEAYDDRFDLVFVPQQIFSLAHLSFLNRLAPRWVVTMHDIIALHCGELRKGDMSLCVEYTLTYADKIITVSEASKESMDADDRTTVIHHGYDREPILKELQEDFLLIVGNHFTHKAIPKALRNIPDGMRTIVLGGKQHRKLATAQCAVLVSGSLSKEQITSLYARCRAVIFPSQYEGFGLPLLHAARHGKPIIAVDSKATREVASAFQLSNIFYFSTYADIRHCINRLESYRPTPLFVSRTWDDVAVDTARVIHDTLASPIDIGLLRKRFSSVSTVMKLRSEYDILRRRTRRLPLRIVHTLVAKILSPFPVLKSRIHHTAYRLGLA